MCGESAALVAHEKPRYAQLQQPLQPHERGGRLRRRDVNEMSMKRFFNIYKHLPGKSVFERTLYVMWWLIRNRLIAQGVLYSNGEARRQFAERKQESESSNRPRIICLTGFGHSGSGAVADLLSEYDDVSVLGLADTNGSLRRESGFEFDILRHVGGVFDLEKAVATSNPFLQDAAVKMFMALVADCYYNLKCFYRDCLLSESRKFLDNIVACIRPSSYGFEYDPHLRMLGDKGFLLFYGDTGMRQAIFTLRRMNQEEYRAISNRFLLTLLSCMSSAKFLVLDQAVSDCSADIKRYKEFLGPMKLIAVYRDQRDVFVTGIKFNEQWIPHDEGMFCEWYKCQLEPYMRLSDKDFLLIRFENLVSDYRSTVDRIERFVGLNSDSHLRARNAFDPAVSVKNIGLYNSYDNMKAISYIQRSLSDFCFSAS